LAAVNFKPFKGLGELNKVHKIFVLLSDIMCTCYILISSTVTDYDKRQAMSMLVYVADIGCGDETDPSVREVGRHTATEP
jgi:hypothetical protein